MPSSKPGPGAHPRPGLVADQKQIATSNATANRFLGGRQPSWLTSGGAATKKLTSRRPSLPQPPVTQAVQQQLQQPAVLPSPAPSDEPSPALSSPLESPKANPSTLPDAHTMVSTATTTAASTPATLPVTSALFTHIAIDDSDMQVVPPPSTINPALFADNRSPAVPRPPLQPLGNGVQDLRQDRQSRSMSSDGGPAQTTTRASAPSLKRRRTDVPSSSVANISSLLPRLEQHIQASRGEQALEPTIEKPRMVLLREACKINDEFFVLLHQLFCIWSLNPRDAHAGLPMAAPTAIDAGFAVLETVLRKNQLMSPQYQQWFARFPVLIEDYTQPRAQYPPVISEIAAFLGHLAHRYDELDSLSMSRQYPFLVDELLSRLGCKSPILQRILFTACRRRLGVMDGPFSCQIEQAFRDDQSRHLDPATGNLVFAPLTYFGEIDDRNATLIRHYRLIVQAATSTASSQPNPQPPTLAGTPPLVSQQQAGRSPPVSQPQAGPASIQIPQQNQPTYAPYSTENPFSPVYPSSALPTPSPVPTMAPNPYAAHRGRYQAATGQTGVPSAAPLSLQLRQTVPSPALHQRRGAGIAPSLQIPTLQSQYLPAQQQPMTPRQQQAAMQNINHQHYRQNAQAAGTFDLQAARHVPQLAEDIRPQQAQYNARVQHVQPLASPAGFTPSTAYHAPSPATPLTATQRQWALQSTDPLFPPKGTMLTRTDWPHDPSDRKAIMMSLHQAHVRSPKRIIKDGETERFYQSIKSLAVGPTPLRPKNSIYEFRFEVTEEQFALATLKSQIGPALLPVVQHFNGALRWRLRCCLVPGSVTTPSEPQWATLEVSWPANIFMTLNGQALDVRRQSHNGKDLPTEITDFIICGTNVLKIGVPDMQRDSNTRNRFMAVEMLETLSHSTIITHIWSRGVIPEEETLATINKRLTSSTDDDVSFEAPDLAIDLADPFSSTIFKVPARGMACTHMECFDLETWLETRPAKKSADCPHGGVSCGCPSGEEPSNPDRWRCPICSKDARPYSLRIDGFLLKVRKQLEEEGKLRTKSMRVKADGSWTVILEEDDDGGSDEEAPAAKKRASVGVGFGKAAKQGLPAAMPSVRREMEVIEID
ncbi:hypothetical protein VTI74DRAFT_3029 [Chaetomium olivicolor]